MKNLLLVTTFLLLSTKAQCQFSFSYNPSDSSWNNYGGWTFQTLYSLKDSTGAVLSSYFWMKTRMVRIRRLNATYNDGTITGRIPWVTSSGDLRVSPLDSVRVLWSKIRSKPTIVTSIGISSTESTITITGSPVTSSGTINIDLPNSGVTAGTYEFVTVNNKGIVTGGYNSVTNSILSANFAFGTAYQASSTSRTFDLDFTISINIGAGLISSSEGIAILETASTSGGTYTEYTRGRNANTGVLAAQNGQTQYIEAKNLPAGTWWRVRVPTPTGTATAVYVIGHETLRR